MKNYGKTEAERLKSNFNPHPLIRHPLLQTVIPSLYDYNNGHYLPEVSQEMLLEVEGGVRLWGYYSPQPAGRAKGLILLLHGWLGSAHSNYALGICDYFYRRGYATFRLNFRDHGHTYHLNPGIFRSDLLAEVFAASQQIARLEKNVPLHIVGVSLGANFALRVAWRHSQTAIPNLGHTIAISPAINGHRTTLALDHGPYIYLYYFRRKWRHALRQKQRHFPDLYDFSEAIAAPTCLGMTAAFVRGYTAYPDPLAYFNSYTVTSEMMAALQSPVTIITAADDTIVPVADIEPFQGLSPQLHVHIQPYGGHVGFMDLFPFRIWLHEAITEIIEGNEV